MRDMTDPLDALNQDLKRARDAIAPSPKRTSQAGYAFRVGTELVSGVAVGCAIGYGLDAWLETRPWMTLIGSIFGFAAGMKLMIQTSQQAGREMEAEEENKTGAP